MFDRQLSRQRHYQRQLSDGVEGSIVEPSDIQNVMVPPQYFGDPPPPYTEASQRGSTPPCVGRTPGRAVGRQTSADMPPPYSVVNESDNAGLLVNEQLFNLPTSSTETVSEGPTDGEEIRALSNCESNTTSPITPSDPSTTSTPTPTTTSTLDSNEQKKPRQEKCGDGKDSVMLEEMKPSDINDLSSKDVGEVDTSSLCSVDSCVSLDRASEAESASVC